MAWSLFSPCDLLLQRRTDGRIRFIEQRRVSLYLMVCYFSNHISRVFPYILSASVIVDPFVHKLSSSTGFPIVALVLPAYQMKIPPHIFFREGEEKSNSNKNFRHSYWRPSVNFRRHLIFIPLIMVVAFSQIFAR